jgi:hypothetical protein
MGPKQMAQVASVAPPSDTSIMLAGIGSKLAESWQKAGRKLAQCALHAGPQCSTPSRFGGPGTLMRS